MKCPKLDLECPDIDVCAPYDYHCMGDKGYVCEKKGEFEFIPPMKAHLSDITFLEQVDNDERWGAGEKFDGYREILYLGKGENEMLSSAGNSHIAKCPQFQMLVPELAGTVLDCEGLSPTRMLEDNAACFKADPVNAVTYQKCVGWARLVAFDVLRYKGEDTTHLPFETRHKILQEIAYWGYLRSMPITNEILVMHSKLAMWKQIVARKQNEGHEGIILKRMDALYRPGRRDTAWLKVKRQETLVCTITGFIEAIPGKFGGMVGSISFTSEGGIAGWTSGMDDTVRADMTQNWSKYLGKKCYIACQEVTRLGALRHPRYLGMVE